ncbi:nucleoside hydrolase [Aerococcus urinae]
MRQIYFNHDGAVDDLVALFLLSQAKDIEILGVGVVPGDCYLEPALSASEKILNRFAPGKAIKIAPSVARPKNPFPKEWREHAFTVDALPVLNEYEISQKLIVDQAAHLQLVDILKSADQAIDLVFTGPLSDLALALDTDSSIAAKINKLYWMGGAFQAKGNVLEPEHDGSAEWNAFWDPEAVERVFQEKFPIDIVALESTEKVPLTIPVRQAWAKERKNLGIDFLGNCYALVPPLVHQVSNSTYYLWDVLTAISYIDPSLTKKHALKAKVATKGINQGQTYEDENGRLVDVIYDVKHAEFFQTIFNLAWQ